MNTHEEYVTYAQAKALKELGFDWPSRTSYYTSNAFPSDKGRFVRSLQSDSNSEMPGHWCSAPTQAVARRWLREVKGIIVCIEYIPKTQEWTVDLHRISDNKWFYRVCIKPTYEAALSAGIDRALQLLKGGEE